MALYWDWKESVGDATFEVNNEREVRITLYEGNALLIMLQEYQEDGEDMYNMFGFWVDKAHMKNCLGLAKGYDNSYDSDYIRLKKIRLNKTKSRNYKDIITALVKAFDNIEIEIYSEGE